MIYTRIAFMVLYIVSLCFVIVYCRFLKFLRVSEIILEVSEFRNVKYYYKSISKPLITRLCFWSFWSFWFSPRPFLYIFNSGRVLWLDFYILLFFNAGKLLGFNFPRRNCVIFIFFTRVRIVIVFYCSIVLIL